MTSKLEKSFAVLAAFVLVGAGTSVFAEGNSRTPISREWILGSLNTSGIQIAPDQMEQLSNVTAAGEKPRLKVVKVEVLDGESDKVRMQCENPNTCLPFYVLLHWGQPNDQQSDLSGRQNGRATKPTDMWVRSGKSAVLVFESDLIRMTLPVLCLQNGGPGQRVRVINKETKKTYLARVTGPGVVTSTLQD
jgi:hypothetical protein